MWKEYRVELTMEDKFAASIPKTKEEIGKMLEHRMPTRKPEGAVPIEELTEKVSEEVGTEGESTEPEVGWATFKNNDKGLYYEGRCIRGHIKDCATQVKDLFPDTKAFKAKVANKVYVVNDVIPIGKDKPDGFEQRFIQVMTRQGPRSTYKYIDYVEGVKLEFTLRVLNDGVITEDMLQAIFDYGSVHGLGQERSQGWGRYSYKIWRGGN